MKPIKIEGLITKITRKNGKPLAEVSVNIPASQSSEIPLGSVIITVEAMQGELPMDSKPLRGDRG